MDINQLKAQIESIRALIAESRIPEAIQSFIGLARTANKPELRDELISISAQQRKLESDTRKYIADASEIEMRQNRLLDHLLELLSDVESGEWVEEEAEESRPPAPKPEKRKKAFPLTLILVLAGLAVATTFLIYRFTYKKANGREKADNACLELKREALERSRLGDFEGALLILGKAMETCADKREVEELVARVEQRRREEQHPEEERPPRHDEPQEPQREEEPGPAGFQVSHATLRASPANFTGACPKRIEFNGAIAVSGGAGVVRYRFIRSDGAQGAVQSLRFDRPGRKPVSTAWTLGAPGRHYPEYWQAIQILEPNPLESEKALFTLHCEAPGPETEPSGPRVTAVRLQAGPADYTGTCPQEIVFLGRITADGPGTVSYRFIRSDGAQGPVQQLRFSGPGTEPVRNTWRLGAPGKEYIQYWQVLKVLEPNEMESNKAFFNLRCR